MLGLKHNFYKFLSDRMLTLAYDQFALHADKKADTAAASLPVK